MPFRNLINKLLTYIKGEQQSRETALSSVHTGTSTLSSTSIFSETQTGHITTRRNSLLHSNIVQNYVLIWLDNDVGDIHNDNYLNSIIELQRIVHSIDKFDEIEECISFLTQIENEKIFLIVSYTFAQKIIPRIHHLPQLDSIYILNKNNFKQKQWIEEWWKVKDIYKKITYICQSLKQAAQQCDRNFTSLSFLSINDNINSQDSHEPDQKFMYTRILKEYLCKIENNDNDVTNFVTYYRDIYHDNRNIIDKFKREYFIHNPIWWYTYPCFLYSMLNKALRTLDIDTIMKLGFFIRHLHYSIKQAHKEQVDDEDNPPFTLYRGQGLSKNDFENLKQAKNKIISFNSFLSTSTNREFSSAWAHSNGNNPEMIGILFQMTIDPSISSIPFAWIGEFSYFKGQEEEVLFSMHTLFLIAQIEPIDTNNNRVWKVELKMINDNDFGLNILTNKIRLETQGSTEWDSLGRLLLKLGKFDKCEEIYKFLLDQTSDENEKAHIYLQIGRIKSGQQNYATARLYCLHALKIFQNINPPNKRALARCYDNIGQIHQCMTEYSEALSFHEKALEMKQSTLSADHEDLAESYEYIGILHEKLCDYKQALSAHEDAIEIHLKILPKDHPTLAHCYENIASVYSHMGEYSKARSYYEQAEYIMQKTLLPDHPDLAQLYRHIGLLYNEMNDHSKALFYHNKALEVYQKNRHSNYSSLSITYNSIGLVYYNTGQYSKALAQYKEALKILKICQSERSLCRSNLVDTYIHMAKVYIKLKQYPKTRSLYEKALKIYPTEFFSIHPKVAKTHNEIGLFHYEMQNHSEALSHYKKAMKIYKKTLIPKHPKLAIVYSNIGSVYKALDDYPKALRYHQRALVIKYNRLSSNHPTIASSHNAIGTIYFDIKKYDKALRSYENAVDIQEENPPQMHHTLIIYYSNIGSTYLHMRQYDHAISAHAKALDICQNSLSPNRSDMASFCAKIGQIYVKIYNYSKAYEFYQRALSNAEKASRVDNILIQSYENKLNSIAEKLEEKF